MTKLIIQIPCLNEEDTLGITLASLPRAVPGIDTVEWLVIDDGSTDKTCEVAKANGVDHLVRLTQNQGLAKAFMAGLDAAVQNGADIIVNTDADNQYCAEDIPKLVEPILSGQAEIVIGSRPINQIAHFSIAKKMFQKLGSFVLRLVSKTSIRDAPSGFRAMSRDAAMKLNVFNEYTYTLETIIQAGLKNIPVVSVPIRVNPDLRPSRLIRSIGSYIMRSVIVIVFTLMTYKPFRFFAIPGFFAAVAGLLLGVRFLVFYFIGDGGGHVQSLILAALLIGCGFFLTVIGLVAELIGVNRKLLEQINWRLKKLEEYPRGKT